MHHPLALSLSGMLVAALVSGCDDAPTPEIRQAASAAAVQAQDIARQASVPVAAIKREASEALTEAKVMASEARPEVEKKLAQWKSSAQIVKNAGQWALLETRVGKYPADLRLYDSPPLAEPLHAVLGADFNRFKTCIATSGPLSKETVLYVTGNKPHAAGDCSAYLIVDPASQRLETGIITNGQLKIYRTAGEPLHQPQEVRIHLQNLAPGGQG